MAKKPAKIKDYNHLAIEKKWQKIWDENKTYKTLTSTTAKGKKPFYILDMFPYPSGAGLHVGHPRGYIGTDVLAHQKRMQGYNVLHPMGYDAFGLPAEQYAITHKVHPKRAVEINVKTFEKQLSAIGLSYDWSRRINTTDPEYYKWTQWIFLQLYNSYYDVKKNKAQSINQLVKIFETKGNKDYIKNGNAHTTYRFSFSGLQWKGFTELKKQEILMHYRLAYEADSEVNWCQELGTVLANDEIVDKDGKQVSERGEYPVEKMTIRQWSMRITAYAERLINGLDTIDFPEHIKTIQNNWIGKSVGAEIDFTIQNSSIVVENKSKITVQLATQSDAEAMAEIHALGWLQNNVSPETGFTKEFLEKERGLVFPVPEKNIQKIQNKIKDNPNNFIVAKLFDDVVGWLGFQEKENGQIDFGVYVHTNLTGKGIGTLLMNYLFEKYPTREFEIEVTKTNERAIKLYKKLGFDIVRESKFFQKEIKNKYLPIYVMVKKTQKITVFTTRADTLFGAFAVIVAPEHDFIEKHKNEIQNYSVVETFVRQVKNKTNEERTDAKNKSGVELKGIKVINPINGELLPVWVADFVLVQYGTGAVFADMHDERDFAFAEKYKLPMKEVLLPNIIDKRNPPVPGKKIVPRQNIHAIVRDPKTGLYLALRWKKFDWTTFPMGGVEEGEDVVTAAMREVAEETGFTDLKLVHVLPGQVRAEYFAAHKDQNRVSYTTAVVFELGSNKRIETSQEEKDSHDIIWLDESKLNYENMTHAEVGMWKEKMDPTYVAYTGEGVLINSGKFTGMSTEVARNEIIKSAGGRAITNYKMRDAIFARQRYWGEPIPLFRDKNGIIHEVKKLPLELPNVKSYEPTGKAEGPLAGVKSWTDKGYETNTMPGWAGSSWYFLRYMDPKNAKSLVGEKEIAYWKNVDVYVGGAEHVTGHLLYSRFWHKFLKDIGVVNTEEPFKKMYNQGLILANDGRKMSKRWGNVINPDDIIKTFGADTLRVYEMFMGPFTASQPWNTESIIGSRRFIERVWRLGQKIIASPENDFSGPRISSRHFSPSAKIAQPDHSKSFSASAISESTVITLHKTIKKVTEDIENFAFNTAISSLMICLNEFESAPAVPVDMFKTFLQLLAPFAPHVTDELWTSFGEKLSIHNSVWPKHNPKKIVSNTVTIGVQVNGKVRAEITIPTDATQADVEVIAMKNEKVIQWLEGKTVQKIIYVPGRLINIAAA